MTKAWLIRKAHRGAASIVAGALLIGTLMMVPAHAEPSKQTIKGLDSSVVIENSGVVASSVLGGTPTLNVGGALATNGATQDIGTMKTNIMIKNSGVAASSVLGGTPTLNIGGALAK